MTAARAARLLVAAAGLVLVLVVLSRGSGPPGPPIAPVRRVLPPEAVPPAAAPPAAESVAPRDVFRYADERAPAAPRGPGAAPLRSPASVPAEPGLRLVGILHKGGTLQAALAFSGEVSLAGVGQRVGGYMVLAIDEESGVRLRGPDGQELTLPLPP